MESLTITKNNLRQIVSESVRATLASELMRLRSLALPTISKKEQKEIEKSLLKADRSIGRKVRLSL
ncbi:MAG: hypothetical protein AAB455_02825 [Patescibacteria group bacterium]